MISVTQLRRGVTFEFDGQIWRVLEYDHYKPGRGGAIIRTKLRNLRTGAIVNRTFPSGDRVQDIRLDHQTVQYLYNEGDLYHFMDMETYEQPVLQKEVLEDVLPYLKEGITLDLELYEGEPIGIEIPITVELEVIEAPPGYAGDTATGATKEVTLETGMKLQVPLFINAGDVLRVDTRTGQYLTRV
ncbi:MAG TPA: elongation factor P [Chloroflexi bacterium]|jgi:elongation factor P|nr:elongation factor P [Chloroflexota bacterium]